MINPMWLKALGKLPPRSAAALSERLDGAGQPAVQVHAVASGALALPWVTRW